MAGSIGNVSGPLNPNVTASSAAPAARIETHTALPKTNVRKTMREQCELAATTSKKLFTNEVHNNPAPMGMGAVFPQINPLPGAERQFSTRNRNRDVYGGQRRPNVRGHIIFTFLGVFENRIPVRDEPRKKAFEIAPHFRISILLDNQRRGGVLHMQGHLPYL